MNTRSSLLRSTRALLAPALGLLGLGSILAADLPDSPAGFAFSQLGTEADKQGKVSSSIIPTKDGAQLRAQMQDLEAAATPEGLWLTSTADEDAGKPNRFRVKAVGVGRSSASGTRHSSFVIPPSGTVRVSSDSALWLRPGLVEEYRVSTDGVRQDFVVLQQPAGLGDLNVELGLTGVTAQTADYGAELTVTATGRELAYSRLKVTDATGKELNARFDVAAADRLRVVVQDAGAVYPVRIDPTFSDADWVALNTSIPGANGTVYALAKDGSDNLYIGGSFTGIGTIAANRIAKWNGSTWSALGTGLNNPVFALVVSGSDLYVGGQFTAAGGVANTSGIAKWNGSAWSALGTGVNSNVNALLVSGSDLYVGGFFDRAGGLSANYVAKWNGTAWSALGTGMNAKVTALAVIGSDLYAGGEFTAAGGIADTSRIAKWDGSTWSALGTGVNNTVNALAVIGSDLYAGGSFTLASGVANTNRIAKWDGSTWSALGTGPGATVNSLAVSGSDLYAGGNALAVSKWNGSTWSALGGGLDSVVNALAVIGSDLYAGGQFNTVGGVVASRIAKWNGSAWSAMGTGMSNSVRAFAVSASVLYVGGDFSTIGMANTTGIAKWNGSAWSALGTGLSGSVTALALSGDDLYAGGVFVSAGATTVNRVAKWNGSTWSALGTGLNDNVYALAVSGSDLYVGGQYASAGGVANTSRIAKWDGSAWSALGTGLNGTVNALAVSGSDLYVGGSFTAAGGVANTSRIAKWDGSSWSALGAGLSDSVFALAVSGSDLYAGGQFTTTVGGTANAFSRIAKWNGSAWSALGTGLNGNVNALAVRGSDFFVGGSFTAAGGVANTSRIAKWNGSAWSALGTGMDGTVNALAADGSGHLFVGGFFVTAGTTFSPFLAQANIGVPAPQIALSGSGSAIGNGDAGVSLTNHTSFGSTAVAGGTVARTFTISNSGDATLNLTGTAPDYVTLSGTGASHFSVTTQPGSATVAPGGTQTFVVTYDPSAFGTHSATVSIASNDSTASPFTFAIQGTGTNSAPTDIALSSSSIAENNAAGATVGTLSATDADASQTHTFSLVTGTGDTDNSSFDITGSTLTLNGSANYEGQPSYSIRVQANDGNGGTFQKAFTISVTDVNEAPTLAAVSKSGTEDTTVTFAAADFTGAYSDPDSNPLNSITVVSLPATGTLKLSGTNVTASQVIPAANLGNLTYVPAADENGAKTFTVTASDGTASSTPATTVTMTLAAVNDAPTFALAGAVTVAEDAGAQTVASVASSISAGPADESAQTVSFTVTNSNNGLFSAQPAIASNGTLTFTPAADANGSATVSVAATDSGGASSSPAQTFTITVTAVNDAPVITSNGGGATGLISIVENTTAVTTVTATDAEVPATQSLTYSKSGPDEALFSIVPATGVLTFTAAPNYEIPLDAGGNNVYNVTVTATDNASPTASGSQDLVITVTNVNEAPTDIALSSSSIAENNAAGATVGTLSATDVDVGQTHTFSLVSGTGSTDNSSFDITGSTLTLNGSANYEGQPSYSIRVQANDGNGGTFEKQFTITVTDVNEAPTLAAVSKSGTEDTTVTFAAADFTNAYSDPDSNALTSITVASLPATGTLKLSGTDVTASQVITAANLPNLAYVPAADENGAKTFTVTASDGTASSTPATTVTMTLAAVNDAPSYALPAGPVTHGATWTARDSNRNWTCIISSADGSKLAAAVYQGPIYTSTDSGATWTVQNAAGNRIWSSIASSADGSKLAAVVNGGKIYISTDSGVTWTERESNRSWQSITSSADGSKLAAVVFSGYIYTSTDGGVTWTPRATDRFRTYLGITSSADGTKLAAAEVNGQLYTSTDSGVNWSPRESTRLWMSIASSADGSKLAATVQNGQIYTSTDSGATWTPRESNRLWGKIVSSADGSQLAALLGDGPYVSSDSGVTWVAKESSRSWHTITSSSDGSKLAATVSNGQIYTSVGTVSPYAVTVAEDAGLQTVAGVASSISAGPVDESAQTVSFTVTNTNNGLFSAQPAIDASGTLTFTPAADANGSATVSVTATDSSGASSSPAQTFTITVTAVNDAPVITSNGGGANGSISIAENTTAVTTVTATDVEVPATQSLTYSKSGPDAARFSIVPATGVLTFTTAPNYEIPLDAGGDNVYNVTVTATDNASPTASGSQDLAITVTNVSEPPVIAAAATSASVTTTSATLGGNVTADGGAPITERGVVYAVTSTNSNPQIGGLGVTKVVVSGTSTGVFTADVTGLSAGTAYSFTAYVTNSDTTSYSNVSSFVTSFNPATGVTVTYSDVIGGTSGVQVTGDGTLALSGSNTYTGNTNVADGSLSFNTVGTGTNPQALGAGSTVNLGTPSTSSGSLIYTGGIGTLDKDINALGNGQDTIQNAGTGSLTLSGTLAKDGTTLTLQGGTHGITVTGEITGSSANSDLVVDGGVVTLNSANSYNGPTYIINGGTLNANAADALPTTPARSDIIMDQTGSGSSTLTLGVSQSVLSLTGATTSVVDLNANTLTVGGASGSSTFAGVISGVGGSLIKDGASELTLTGANTYTGGTTVSAGTIVLGNQNGFGTGTVTLADGVTFKTSGFEGNSATGALPNAFVLSGGTVNVDVSFTGANDMWLNTSVSGAGGLSVTAGAGIVRSPGLMLSGAKTFTGGVTIGNNARVTIDNNASLGTGGLQAASGTGRLRVAGNLTGVTSNAAIANGVTLMVEVDSGLTGVLSGVISGVGGSLTKDSAGTLTLSGANTYTGATTISAGVLNIQNADALGTTAAGTSVTSGAALQIQGGITTVAEALTLNGTGVSSDGALRNISGDNNFAGLVTLGSAARINSDAGTLTLSNTGTITGATLGLTVGGAGNTMIASIIGTTTGTLTKDGAGTLTLTAANTYTGTTTVSAGTLALSGSGRLSDSSAVSVSGGTFDIGSVSDTVGAVTLTSGSITGSTGVLTGSSYAVESGSVSAILGGTGVGLTKSTAGTVTLSGVNTYSGTTTVSAGTLSITGSINSSAAIAVNGGLLSTNGADKLADSAAVTVGGGTLTIGGNDTVGTLTLNSGTIGGSATLTAATYGLAGGTVDGNLGAGTINSSGTVALNGTAAATTVNVTAGALTLGASSAINSATVVAISGGSLTLGASNQIGNAAVTVSGTGVLDLSTFSDTVDTFSISGGSLNGSGTLTATTYGLSGGTVTANLGTGTINSSGTVALNGTAGATTMNVTAGALTLGASSAINSATTVDISAGSLTLGASNQIGNAAVTVSGTGVLDLSTFSDTVDTFSISGGSLNGSGTLTATTYGLSGGTVTANLGAGTINSSGTVALNGTAAATTVNITGGTLSLGNNDRLADGATVTVSGGTLGMGTRTDTVSIFNMSSGSITGSGMLTATTYGLSGGTVTANLGAGTINSSGTVALNGTAAATTVNITGGTLTLGSADRLADTAAVTLTGGATLAIGGNNDTVGALTLTSGSITGSGGVLTGSSYAVASGSVSAILGGTGVALTKTTTGTVTLSGANTYTGTTTISAGTLQIGNGGTTGSLSASSAIVNNATLEFNRSDTITQGTNFNSVISGTGAVTQAGSGTVVLNGANTYTGATTISAGTLQIDNGGSLSTSSAIVNDGTITFNRSTTITQGTDFNSVISGSGALRKTGSGTLVLNGANTYTGTTTISGGTLQIGSGGTTGSLSTSSGIVNNATLVFNRSNTITQGTDFNTVISGSGAVTQAGSGTTILSGANTYTGATSVTAGVLNIRNASALGTAAAGTSVTSGAALQIQGGITTGAEALTLNGTGVSSDGALRNISDDNDFAGLVTLGSAARINSDSGTLTLSNTGTITGATLGLTVGGAGNTTIASIIGTTTGTLTKDGAGTLTLTAANTYTGTTTISAGTLALSGSGRLSDSSAVSVSGGTFDIGSVSDTVGAVTLSSGSITGSTGVLTGSSYAVASGSVSAILGGSGVTLTKTTASTVTLSGVNTYTGATTISAGALALSGAGALSDSSAVNVNGATGVFDLSGITASSETVGSLAGVASSSVVLGAKNLTAGGDGTSTIFTGVISGTDGSFTKAGTGTLTLNGANTYTGATTVSAGILNIQNAAGLGSTAGGTSVTGGATLQLQGGITVGAEALTLNGGAASGQTGALVNVSGSNTYGGQITVAASSSVSAASGSVLTLTGGLVKDGTTLTFNGGGTITVNTTGISGASANSDLVIDGTTVNLNVANTYNGPTTIRNSGTLNANASGALPTATRSAVTFDGTGTSVLALGADQVVASLTSAGMATVTLDTNTLTIGNASGSTAFAGAIGGTGGLTKDGASTQTLTGSNTYTGATTISAGTLALSGSGALSDSSAVNLSGATGVFDISAITAGGETIGSLAGVASSSVVLGSKTLTAGGNNTSTTFAGVISGLGSLTKAGTGALTLSGANTYSGTTTLNSGSTLNLNHATAIGSSVLVTAGNATINNTSGGAITLSNNNDVTLSGGSLTFTGTNNLSFGSGTVTISGANRTITTSGGVLTIGGVDATATNLRLTKDGVGTLVITGAAGANFQGGFLNDDGIVIIGDKGALGTGTLTMQGGTLQASTDLSGVNALTVSDWVLGAGGAIFSGSNSITIGNSTTGITADRSITNDLAASKTLSLGSFSISSDATNRTLTVTGSGDTAFTGVVSNGGSAASNLLKSGTGKLTLSAANTYAGATTISAGTLELTGGGSLSDSTAVNLTGATGVFDISAITASGETIGSLAGVASSSVVLGGKNLTAGGDNTSTGFAGVLSGSGGSFTKTGGGTLTLGGANTYTGTTTIETGTLALSGSGRISDSSSVVVAGGTFDIGSVSDTVAGVQLTSGSITGSSGVLTSTTTYDVQSGSIGAILGGTVGLTKTTTGTVTLSGVNTYTGATTLTAGDLVVNGSIGNSSMTTINGGTLRGTGTVGAIQLNSGGAINPGGVSTAGTLSTGNIAIVDGQLRFNLGGTGAVQYDQINTTGGINLAAGGAGAKLVLDAIGTLATTLANDALSGYTTTNALNNAFTLVSNDLVDAITGKFAKGTFGSTNTEVVTISGLDYVKDLLGTGYYGRINYAGESTDAGTLATAGNDIVLKIVTPEITVTEGATTLTDNGGYDFGDVDKVIPAIPVTKTFTIKNDGEVDLMNIAITALTGVAAGDYSLNTTGTATNLIPGASTTFTVTFDPQRIGTRNAYFSITSSDLNEATFDIPLTGVGSVARDLIADGPAPTDSWAVAYSGVDAPTTKRNGTANAVAVQHSTTADEAVAVFATGYTTNAAGDKDIYVMKYNPSSGAQMWASPVIVDGGVGRDDEALAIAVDGSGNVVVAGYQTVGLGNTDVYVAKFSGVDGTLAWSKTYSGAGGGLDAAVSLALDPSGNVAVAGYGRNASANQDVFMARYLANGTEVFAYLIDGGASRTDGANTVATDAAGSVYAAGYRNVAAGNKDCYIIKMDSTGGFVWEQTIAGTSVTTGSDDEVYSMALDATGNPVLGGTLYNSTGYDLFAAKLDATTGVVQWQKSEDPYGFNDSFRDVLVDRNGNIVMAGVSHTTATTTQRYVSKYTTDGVLIWNARLNSANSTTGNLWTGGIALDGEENVVVTGFSSSGGTRDVYTAKLKGRDGSQLWERTYDGGVAGGADDEGIAVASSLDGYIYVAGYAGVDGGTKAFLLKHYKPLTAPVQTPQIISFPALAEQGVGGEVKLVATATSGLRVRFLVVSGPGELSGPDNDLLTITGLGTVVVRASQTGNFEYAPAANVQQSLVITKQAQTITFTLPASTYYTNVVALGATASSGLAVTYSVASDPSTVATILGNNLSFSGPGFVTVRASQAGDGTRVAAPDVDVTIEATNTPPVIFPSDIAQRWANTFAGTGAGAARAVALKPAGGAATAAVITGYTTTAGGGRDIYTAQYNASGGVDWQATYSGAGVLADEGVAVTVDGAGNVYVAGYTTVSGAGTDVIVIMYNSAGVEQWVRTFAGSTASGDDAATSIALVGSDVVVAGYLTNATRDFFAARITSANTLPWGGGLSYDAGTIEGSTSKADAVSKVAVDSSENIALVGNSASSSNNIDDIWTVKLDGATGTRQWHKRYNGTLNREDRGNGVGFDNVGNVLITGWTNGQASSQTYDIYTAKYAAADGALVWQTTYNGPNSLNDSSRDLKVDSQGSVIVVGVSNNASNQDMWTGKFNGQTGALEWEKLYNNNRNDVGLSVSLDPNGNPVVTGSSADVFGSVDIYTVKYSNADGSLAWDPPSFQRYEAINGRSDAPAMVAADGAGSVYVAGHHTNSSGVTEALLVRYAPATVLPPPPLPPPPLPPPPAFGEEEIFAAAPPPPPALQLFLNVEHGDLAQFGAEFSDAEGNDTVDFTATIDGSPGGVLDVDATVGRFTWEYDTSTIAPGAHEVVITATDTAGSSTSVNLAVTLSSTHPERTWRWENFGSTVASGNAADDADPDGDGLANLAEFAFGLDPTRGSSDTGSRAEVSGGQGGMRAVFRRRKDHAASGLEYNVEFSSNLGDWTPSSAIPVVIADEGVLERVGLVFPVLPDGSQSRFFRINIQQQNSPAQ